MPRDGGRPQPDPASGLVVWGAKGHALVLAEFAVGVGYRVAVLVDNDPTLRTPLDDVPLVCGADGLDTWLQAHPGEATSFAVAIGGRGGRDRLTVHEQLEARGLRPTVLVHPAAYVAGDSDLGAASQVLAGAVVGSRAQLGRQCIVNTSASVDHECVLADGVHIGPGATLSGCVSVGVGAFVGAGAVVLPHVVIGPDAVVGAGAVVTRDVPAGTVVTGVPARPSTTPS